jgi:hypothetical protein
MATLEPITIQDQIIPNLTLAYEKMRGYQRTIDGEPNPQSVLEFIRQGAVDDAKLVLKQYLLLNATATAEAQVDAVINNIQIT